MQVRVIIDSPQKNSSIVYSTGYTCLDSVAVVDIDSKVFGFFPATEYEKARKNSRCFQVFNLSEKLEKINEDKKYLPSKSAVVYEFLLSKNITEITVPESFPVYEADYLRELGVNVRPMQEPFYSERVVKSEDEIEFIRDNSLKNCQVMDGVRNIIASSSVLNDGRLFYDGEYLTSEFIQSYILKEFLDKGLTADMVIAASGNQGCDPHESGYGYIKASESIIVDIFPKSRINNYYTDMTRTFCKWKASDDLLKIYDTVKEAQMYCLSNLYSGVKGADLHGKVYDFFLSKGFKSGVVNGVLQGFFHGTGHGVGLDCHEAPYISKNGRVLEKNSIVTVEPGLYYLDKGAVRIEDIVVVKDDGVDNLTNYPKELIVE